jgi:hypothetical protein
MNLNFISLIFLVLLTGVMWPAKRYWIGNGSNTNWNNTSNWSATSGGSGGSSVPGTSDTAYFDGNGTGRCIFDIAVNVRRFEILTGYNTDTIFQNKKGLSTLNGFRQQGGVFWGDSTNTNFTGVFVLDGGVYRATESEMTIFTGLTKNGGTFLHNNGTIRCSNNPCTFTGSITFYNWHISSVNNYAYTISTGTTVTVLNALTLSGTGFINQNGGTLLLEGDLYMNNSNGSLGGSTSLEFTGSKKQHLYGRTTTGGLLSGVVKINKTGDTLFLHDRIPIHSKWTYVAGNIEPGNSTVQIWAAGPPAQITGTHTLNNLFLVGPGAFQFTNSTITLKGDLTINGTVVHLQYGTINIMKDIYARANGTNQSIGTNTVLNIIGTGTQTFFGDETGTYLNRFPTLNINKPSGTFNLIGTVYIEGGWNYISGTINPGNSTVYFIRGKTLIGTHTLYNISFSSLSTGDCIITIANGTTLTADGNVTINGAGYVALNTGLLNVKGNLTITNTSTSTSGGGTANLYLNGTGDQKITGQNTLGLGGPPNIFIDKTSGTLTIAGLITARGNWTYTQGSVNADTSTVGFYGTKNLDGEGTNGCMAFNKVEINNSRTLTGKLVVSDNFKINASATLTTGGFDMVVGGNWTNNGTFSTSGGFVTLNGTSTQTVSRPGSTETFKSLKLNKANTGTVILGNPIIITDTLDLTEGIIESTASNYIKLNDNAFARKGSDSGFVKGPMRKAGNDAFVFPLGGSVYVSGLLKHFYHPVEISAPSNTSDEFSAEYFGTGQTTGSALDSANLESISDCEYWEIVRLAGSSSPTPSISWNTNSCNAENLSDMVVGYWDSGNNRWASAGNGGMRIDSSGTGNLKAASPIQYPTGKILIAMKKNTNRVFATLKYKLDGGYFNVYDGNLYFRYDEDYEDTNQKIELKIYRVGDNKILYQANTLYGAYFGDNRYFINLTCKGTGLDQNGWYILEITNEKSEKQFLKFRNSTNITCNCNFCLPTQ